MAFEICLKQTLANIIGQKIITVQNDPVNGEMITVGNYRTHSSNAWYVKEV